MPLLISVTVLLAGGFVLPAHAADHAEVADYAVLRRTDDGFDVEVDAADPRAFAGALLVRALRGFGGSPEPWEVAAVRRSIDRGEAWPIPTSPGRGLVFHVTQAHLQPLIVPWTRTTSWHQRISLASTPEGPVVLAPDPAWLLQIGDVLLKTDGAAPPPFADMDSASAMGCTVLREGRFVEGPYVVHAVEPPDLRKNAPTCGPCCHGHCDDGRYDGLDLR